METGIVISMILLWIVVIFHLLLTLAIVRKVNRTSHPAGLRRGQRAPEFTAQTLTGERVTLQDYAGHPTTFVFISTGCGPCKKLLPELEALGPGARQAGDTLVLVSADQHEEARDYISRNNIHLPVLVAPREENPFFQHYQIQGTPSYCSIDAQSKVQSAGHPDVLVQGWKTLVDGWAKRAETVSIDA